MDDIIDKTKKLIKAFDESDMIKNLDYYKDKVISNNKLMELIDKYNSSSDDYDKMSLKKDIYNYDEYAMYMKYYNELFFYILKINKKFYEYSDVGGCHK